MPKVPQVFASGDIGGSGLVQASPEGFANASLSGLNVLSRSVSQVAADYAKAQDLVAKEEARHRKEQGALDAEIALGEMQRQFADADVGFKQDPNVTAEQYPKQVDESLRAIKQGVSRSLTTPEARLAFEKASVPFMATKSVAGKYEGLAMGQAQEKASTDMLLRQDANIAVFAASPAEREAAQQRGLQRIRGMTGRILTGGEANARTLSFLAEIEEGQVKRDLQNPETRIQATDTLANGRLRYLTPDAQLTLLGKSLKEDEAAQTKRDDKLAKEMEADKQASMSAFAQSVLRDKEPTPVLLQKLDQIAAWHRLKDTEYERLFKLMTEPDVPSDPTTLRQVIADTHSMNPRLSDAALNSLFDQKLLNKKDWVGALDRRRETLEANRREGQSLVMQQHAQAEQELFKAVGIITPFSQLDKTQEKLAPDVLTELRRRSNAYPGGKEAPLAVLEDLLPRVRATLGRDAALNRQELERLVTYPSASALEEAKRRGMVSDGFYKSEKDRLLRLDDARKREQEAQEKAQPKPGASKPATGGFNPFGRAK